MAAAPGTAAAKDPAGYFDTWRATGTRLGVVGLRSYIGSLTGCKVGPTADCQAERRDIIGGWSVMSSSPIMRILNLPFKHGVP